MERVSLCILMPALNEEKSIWDAVAQTLTAFDDFSIAGEVIVIDDGSTDKTAEIVMGLQTRDPRIRLIRHDSPEGIGASFWDGVDHTKKEAVCMIPGDNENDPWEIMRYFKLLEHVDIVIPFVYNKGVRSLFRNALSFIYRFFINSTFMVYFNYTNGTVLYRRSILKELDYRSTGFFFQSDILIRAVKKGYLFAEVPYRLRMRANGVSRAMSFPSLLQVVRGYVRLVRDIYYRGEGKDIEIFSKDSLTALRRGETEPFHQHPVAKHNG